MNTTAGSSRPKPSHREEIFLMKGVRRVRLYRSATCRTVPDSSSREEKRWKPMPCCADPPVVPWDFFRFSWLRLPLRLHRFQPVSKDPLVAISRCGSHPLGLLVALSRGFLQEGRIHFRARSRFRALAGLQHAVSFPCNACKGSHRQSHAPDQPGHFYVRLRGCVETAVGESIGADRRAHCAAAWSPAPRASAQVAGSQHASRLKDGRF